MAEKLWTASSEVDARELLCRADALVRTDRSMTLIDKGPARQLDISLGTTHSTVHDQPDYRKRGARWVIHSETDRME